MLFRSDDFDPFNTEILGRNGVITAVSGPVWERHVATLRLAQSDAWTFWGNLFPAHDIKNLRALVQRRRNDIVSAKAVLSDLQEVAVSVQKGDKVQIDAKTGLVTTSRTEKNVQVDGKVPDGIVLRIPVYADQETYDVGLDITPSMDASDKLSFSLELVDPDAVVRQAWNNQIAKVREGLGPDWLVGIGEIKF